MPDYLTVAEAARVLRVGPKAVYAAIKAGTLPAVRLGRLLRVPVRALDFVADPSAHDGLPPAASGDGKDGNP